MNFKRNGKSPGLTSPNHSVMKLDKQLKTLLRQSDTTVAQLARATGVSPKTVYNWLEGQKPRDIDAVKRVADHFKVTVDYLCFSTPQPTSPGNEIERHLDEIHAGTFEVVLRRPNRGT